MKKVLSVLLVLLVISLISVNVYAEDKYIIESTNDINNISNEESINDIEIRNMTIDDLSFLNNYKNINSITIIGSTISINNLDEELINKIVYRNTYIKGEYNTLYKFKNKDSIVNTEYSYNPKYDDEFSRMAKYIYIDGITDEQIVKKVTLFVLDYMELNENINHEENSDKCYSHYGICSNYTELEAVLLNKLGIYAITINGYTDKNNEKDSYHSWNLVYLNNKWYIIDPVYLDLYDSSDAIKNDLSVEYYMKEITRDFSANHIAYYNHLYIPTDFLISKISILDRLDEIGEYTPTQPEVPEEPTTIDYKYLNEQVVKVGALFLIAIIVIIITIKDKKKLRSKITR